MMLPVRSVLLFLFISTSAVLEGVRAAQDGSYQEEVQQGWQGHQHTCAHDKVRNFTCELCLIMSCRLSDHYYKWHITLVMGIITTVL